MNIYYNTYLNTIYLYIYNIYLFILPKVSPISNDYTVNSVLYRYLRTITQTNAPNYQMTAFYYTGNMLL